MKKKQKIEYSNSNIISRADQKKFYICNHEQYPIVRYLDFVPGSKSFGDLRVCFGHRWPGVVGVGLGSFPPQRLHHRCDECVAGFSNNVAGLVSDGLYLRYPPVCDDLHPTRGMEVWDAPLPSEGRRGNEEAEAGGTRCHSPQAPYEWDMEGYYGISSHHLNYLVCPLDEWYVALTTPEHTIVEPKNF